MLLRIPALLALCVLDVALAAVEIPPWVPRFIGLGRTNSVIEWVDKGLAVDPDNANLYAIRGAALTRDERFVEALPDFDKAEGSDFYEETALRYHADALRETGDVAGAVALRESQLAATDLRKGVRFTQELRVVQDLQFGGELVEAHARAEELVNLYPHIASAWATLAELQTDLGDTDGAMISLHMGGQVGKRAHRQIGAAKLHLMRALGDEIGAAEAVVETGKRVGGRRDYWNAYLDYQLELGNAAYVLGMLDRRRFARNRSPALAALRVRALVELGAIDEARERLHAALADYPTHPAVMVAAQVFEAAAPE
jgi:tetratricopeptide (TPR) repeat protein